MAKSAEPVNLIRLYKIKYQSPLAPVKAAGLKKMCCFLCPSGILDKSI